MKTLTQIALATIVFTTSLMAFAEPATTNEAQSEASTITVKHESMTVTLTDKHFTSPDEAETETANPQTLTQNHKTNSTPQSAI